MTYVWVPILIAVLIAGPIVFAMRRHRRDYRKHLEPVLANYGYTYVSSRWPGFFKTGPFPKFEVEVGVSHSHKMGVRGEYDEYRIVVACDEIGTTFTLWACIVIESFQIREIRWRVASDSDVPVGMEQLLER